jgi:hypothetical protein
MFVESQYSDRQSKHRSQRAAQFGLKSAATMAAVSASRKLRFHIFSRSTVRRKMRWLHGEGHGIEFGDLQDDRRGARRKNLSGERRGERNQI